MKGLPITRVNHSSVMASDAFLDCTNLWNVLSVRALGILLISKLQELSKDHLLLFRQLVILLLRSPCLQSSLNRLGASYLKHNLYDVAICISFGAFAGIVTSNDLSQCRPFDLSSVVM
jgi:hypothetical protein